MQGTSFAAAFVAGAAALVKPAHPSYTAAQVKSALANSAAPALLDGNAPARSIATGAGRLNIPAAMASSLTVAPVSVSFGAVTGGLGSPRTVNITNTGSAAAGIQLTVSRRDADSSTSIIVAPAAFNLSPGQSQSIAISLTGRVPAAGIYEGSVALSGGTVPLQIAYRYVVGDGKPFQLTPLLGANFLTETGTAVNVALRALDRYGLPVQNLPVRFAPASSVLGATAATDSLGIAEAYMNTSPAVGDQSFEADLAENAVRLTFSGRTRTATWRQDGVVDAASGQVPKGFAPGSYLTIFGSGLSESTVAFHTPYLPLSLAGVAVSFDVPDLGLHFPGRLHFVSSGQINVQIPWELAGAPSALMKVTLSNSDSQSVRADDLNLGTFQTQVVSVPLAAYSPAFFEYRDSNTDRTLAAALNEAYYRLVCVCHS